MKLIALICLLAVPVVAEAPKEDSVLVTLRGALSADGKPVTAARFSLTPSEAHTAVALDKKGQFEVKAVASREYAVSIDAEGYAPWRKTVELDERGVGELGSVKLAALRTARVQVLVAPRGALAGVKAQQLDLRHGACANVRAQDDSGCLLTFCVNQEGPTLQVSPYSSGQLHSVGRVSLSDAAARLPRGTFVTGGQQLVDLVAGETLASELPDQYCAALVHVVEVK